MSTVANAISKCCPHDRCVFVGNARERTDLRTRAQCVATRLGFIAHGKPAGETIALVGRGFRTISSELGAPGQRQLDGRQDQATKSCESTSVLYPASRFLNLLTGGSRRELFCSRAYRNGWSICRHIDRIFRFLREDDREHCRACFVADMRCDRIGQGATAPIGSASANCGEAANLHFPASSHSLVTETAGRAL